MLNQRRRRWSNIQKTLGERLVFFWDVYIGLHITPGV